MEPELDPDEPELPMELVLPLEPPLLLVVSLLPPVEPVVEPLAPAVLPEPLEPTSSSGNSLRGC